MFIRFRAVAVLLVAAVAATWLATTPAAAAGTRTLSTWQWNVAGWTMHHASTGDGMTAAAAASIVAHDPDIAVFSELCRQQYDDLIHRLRAAGWPQDGSNFARWQTDLASGCDGAGFGQAVFTRAPAGAARRTLLPEDNRAESHYLLCVPIADTAVMGCGTHITIDGSVDANGIPANTDQLAAALAAVDQYSAQGSTVTVGGDFNAQPQYGRMSGWHHNWTELDDTDTRCTGYGEWTATGTPGAAPPCAGGSTTCTTAVSTGCGKIDLQWIRTDRIAGSYSGDAAGLGTTCPAITATAAYPAGSCSDHRIVVGTVTVPA